MFRNCMNATCPKPGLTAAQFTLVAAIGRRPGVQMADLADAMVMDRTTLVRALKPLQRDGIVEAAPESSASRAVGLRLSASGKETLAQAVLRWQAAQAEFEQKFGRRPRAGIAQIPVRVDIDGLRRNRNGRTLPYVGSIFSTAKSVYALT